MDVVQADLPGGHARHAVDARGHAGREDHGDEHWKKERIRAHGDVQNVRTTVAVDARALSDLLGQVADREDGHGRVRSEQGGTRARAEDPPLRLARRT